MGDTHRNKVFASFIKKQFPKIKSVLVVADGKGALARELAGQGLQVRVIEAKPRYNWRDKRGIKYQRGWFTREHKIAEDLVVGMHPDEATGEIIMAATANRKPWAVVPCCLKGEAAKGVLCFKGWLNRLRSLARNQTVLEWQLPIKGKNVVLFHKK